MINASRSSRADRVQQQLEAARRFILTTLKRNDTVTEKRMMVALGCKRPAVRRTLVQLARDGLVVTVPRVGTRVADVDLDKVKRSLGLRSALEEFLAEKVIQRRHEVDLKPLYQIQRLFDGHGKKLSGDAALTTGQAYETLKMDQRFHLKLAEVAGYPEAVPLLRELMTTLLLFFMSPLRHTRAMLASIEEHHEILRALSDPTKTVEDGRRAIRAHLQRALERFCSAEDMLPGNGASPPCGPTNSRKSSVGERVPKSLRSPN